jgi:hypothetical protein
VAHRLLDVSRKTQVDQIARALQALGKRVVVGMEEAEAVAGRHGAVSRAGDRSH